MSYPISERNFPQDVIKTFQYSAYQRQWDSRKQYAVITPKIRWDRTRHPVLGIPSVSPEEFTSYWDEWSKEIKDCDAMGEPYAGVFGHEEFESLPTSDNPIEDEYEKWSLSQAVLVEKYKYIKIFSLSTYITSKELIDFLQWSILFPFDSAIGRELNVYVHIPHFVEIAIDYTSGFGWWEKFAKLYTDKHHGTVIHICYIPEY